MDKRCLVLAGMAPASGATYTPVQIQKLFFLIDRVIPHLVDGPMFDFRPYDYGPFDPEVYAVLTRLRTEGSVEIEESGRVRRYRLTELGQEAGSREFHSLAPAAKDYIARASNFVRSLPFQHLVAAIYKAFPDMKANSVFQG
jgi:hypothetical protein